MELKDLYIGKIVLHAKRNLPVVIRDLTFNSCGDVIVVVSFPTIEDLSKGVVDLFMDRYLNSDARWLYKDSNMDLSKVPVHPEYLKEL